jgi:hydrogenase maturation protease
MTVVVGSVGTLFQGDMDVGRYVADRIVGAKLGDDVVVEDFYYGAIAVMQMIEDLKPSALIVVGAERTGAPPGSVRRHRVRIAPSAAWEIQDAVGAAATGHVAIPLVINVAAGFGVLPWRTTTVEVEPATLESSDHLSPPVDAAVPIAAALIRREVGRIRLLQQADAVQRELDESTQPGSQSDADSATRQLRLLLRELRRLDDDGNWGAAPAIAEKLRQLLEESSTAAPEVAGRARASARALLDQVEAVLSGEAAAA